MTVVRDKVLSFLAQKKDERVQKFREAADATSILKPVVLFFACDFFYLWFDSFVRGYMLWAAKKQLRTSLSVSRWTLERFHRHAVDRYHALVLLTLVAAHFLLVTFLVSLDSPVFEVLVNLVLLLMIFRLMEIWSVQIQLHFSRNYRPRDLRRAIVHAFLHFLEFALCFGTFYYLAWYQHQAFDCCIDDDFFSPFFIAFLALGFDDAHAATPFGKILVVTETFSDLVYLVFVIEDILGSKQVD